MSHLLLRLFLVNLAFSSILFSCKPQSDSSDTIQAVTENAYRPLNFADKNGKGIGFEYDLTNTIAQKLNKTVIWNTSSWDVMLQGLRDQQFDVAMDGIAITPERAAQVDFSRPYMQINHYLITRMDEKRFEDSTSFAANDQLIFAAQSGTTNYYAATTILGTLPEEPGNRIRLYENFGASIQALITGDVDAVIIDGAAARAYLNKYPDQLLLLPQIISSEDIAFAFPKGSPWVAKFNQVIDALDQDGTLKKLEQYWFVSYQD
jgi:polar amino acid transport system substrate-binding protein